MARQKQWAMQKFYSSIPIDVNMRKSTQGQQKVNLLRLEVFMSTTISTTFLSGKEIGRRHWCRTPVVTVATSSRQP